jgi:drug/metabolite transporter (DMT)-like permease
VSIKAKVHSALFIVSLIYGATFTLAKLAMPAYVGAFAFILLRIWTATVLLFIFHSLFIRERVHKAADFKQLFVCSIFGVVANMLFFFKGLSLTVPINAAVLMMNTPIFVVVFATLMLREKLGFKKVTGILLACLGAVLLMAGTKLSFNFDTALGDLFVTLNAIIYAFFLVYAKPLTQRYHPLTITLYAFIFGSVLVLPFGWHELQVVEWHSFPPQVWLVLIFVTVGSTFITYVLNAYALRHASPSLVGTYIYLQPVLATLIAVFSGRDDLSWLKLLYIAIIFGGVYLVSSGTKVVQQKEPAT